MSINLTALTLGPNQPVVLDHSADASPRLLIGEQVSATVLKPLPDGRFVVNIKGSLMEALATEHFQSGQQLRLKVTRLEPKPVLQVIQQTPTDEAVASEILRRFLPQLKPAGQSLAALEEALAQLGQTGSRMDPMVMRLHQLFQRAVHIESIPTPAHIAQLLSQGGEQIQAKVLKLLQSPPRELSGITEPELQELLFGAAPGGSDPTRLASSGSKLQVLAFQLHQWLQQASSMGKVPTPAQIAAFLGREGSEMGSRLLKNALTHPERSSAPRDDLAALLQRVLRTLPDGSLGPRLNPAIAGLRDWIGRAVNIGTPPTPSQIATFIRDGGLNYEARLLEQARIHPEALSQIANEDLKGLLLGALEGVSSEKIPSTLTALLSDQVRQIETRQASNFLAQLNQQPYRLDIPFFGGRELNTVSLAIQPEEREKSEEGQRSRMGYRILFILQLDGLGKTRIDAYLSSGVLQAVFYLEKAAAVPVMRQELASLEEALRASGFSDILLNAKPMNTLSTEQREEFKSALPAIPKGVSLLDVIA
ncbi:MAG: hypothetical protein ACE5JX_14875 [Acidobacteriota bacterium]